MTDKIEAREFEETAEFREEVEKALAKNPEAVKLMADIDDAQDKIYRSTKSSRRI